MANSVPVYVHSWNAFMPGADSVGALFDRMRTGISSCKAISDSSVYPEPFYASVFNDSFQLIEGFSKLESILVYCLNGILGPSIAQSENTVFIFSSTKGNIDLLVPGQAPAAATYLWHTAQKIASHFGNPNKALTVSNACVSGIMAQNLGHDLLKSGQYKQAVVFGADLASAFVVSGFGSFKAMSAEASKPFDKNRTGINLGEGAGALILSTEPGTFPVRLTGTGSSNDANHISGPSRTGDGLLIAIKQALKEAGKTADQIDYLSAHGTATPYNDEMESLAFADAGLSQTPLNSMKGYFGHTLGAAGLIESCVVLESMKQELILASKGFEENGVSGQVNVLRENKPQRIQTALKTGSGFGGCNAASVFEV